MPQPWTATAPVLSPDEIAPEEEPEETLPESESPPIKELTAEWQRRRAQIRELNRRPNLSTTERNELQAAQKRKAEIDQELIRLRQPRESAAQPLGRPAHG
ncbi:MAG: hypothetical protein HYV42_00560 [Candidatus Magasanikbacteria bacterium]|nr:hypothetical protein [Candidatus Magasanikbacteria bacterium]